MPSTADACDREAAWLNTSGDGLPALAASAGGPFQVVQAYWDRTPRKRATGIYVLRRGIHEDRFANVRTQDHYEFLLRLVWPITTSTGSGESEQRALDAAVQLLLVRIRGFVEDKTHGGRFLSVAENPRLVQVEFDEPEESIAAHSALEAKVTYAADDDEYTA